jgi:hypothetical protein
MTIIPLRIILLLNSTRYKEKSMALEINIKDLWKNFDDVTAVAALKFYIRKGELFG